MWTFKHIKLVEINGHKLTNIPSEWVLCIKDDLSFLIWWMKTEPQEGAQAYSEELIKIKKKSTSMGHYTSSLASLVDIKARARGTSFVDELVDTMSQKYTNMLSVLAEGKELYIKFNGSYSFAMPGYEIIETHKSNKMTFPTSQDLLKIEKFPNGRHYYAKIGLLEIVGKDGKNKWNTYFEANRVAQEYIKEMI